MYEMKDIRNTEEFEFDEVVENDVLMLINNKEKNVLILPIYLVKKFKQFNKNTGIIKFITAKSNSGKLFIMIRDIV